MEEKTIKYDRVAILIDASPNTIRGYSTKKGGNIFKAERGGVPYPIGVIDVIKHKMSVTPKNKGEKLKELEEHYLKIISKPSYNEFLDYIDSIQEKKGLLKKVLETEEKQEIPEMPETLEPSKEPDTKYEKEPPEPPKVVKVEEEVDSAYNLREYLASEPKKKTSKTRQSSYPHLTEKELNMPLDNLVDLTLRKIDRVKKSIRENPKTKKQRDLNKKREERLSKLWIKYRSIINPFKDGVFNEN